jgi:hypothetical protein
MNMAAAQDRAPAGDVLGRSDARWLRLREIIRAHSLKRGDFVLSSGRFFLILAAMAGMESNSKMIGA